MLYVSNPKRLVVHLGVFKKEKLLPLLDVSTVHLRVLSCTWMWLHTIEAYGAYGRAYKTGAWAAPGLAWACLHGQQESDLSDLHLDVPRLHLQELVLLLDLSTLQWHVLHLNVSGQQEHGLAGTCLRHRGRLQLNLIVSTIQMPLLHLDVSTPQGLSCTWMCLNNRSHCCSSKCPHYRDLSCSEIVYTSVVCKEHLDWTCLQQRDHLIF